MKILVLRKSFISYNATEVHLVEIFIMWVVLILKKIQENCFDFIQAQSFYFMSHGPKQEPRACTKTWTIHIKFVAICSLCE